MDGEKQSEAQGSKGRGQTCRRLQPTLFWRPPNLTSSRSSAKCGSCDTRPRMTCGGARARATMVSVQRQGAVRPLCSATTHQVGVEAVHAMPRVGVVVLAQLGGADVVHDLVLTLAGHLVAGEDHLDALGRAHKQRVTGARRTGGKGGGGGGRCNAPTTNTPATSARTTA